MENFITGYPGHEDGMRRSLKSVMDQEKYDHYFNSFLHHFFTEKDADFFKEVSLFFPCLYPHSLASLVAVDRD